eukprot:jgi/Botrbrau1/8491/Bobra.0237s0106.1
MVKTSGWHFLRCSPLCRDLDSALEKKPHISLPSCAKEIKALPEFELFELGISAVADSSAIKPPQQGASKLPEARLTSLQRQLAAYMEQAGFDGLFDVAHAFRTLNPVFFTATTLEALAADEEGLLGVAFYLLVMYKTDDILEDAPAAVGPGLVHALEDLYASALSNPPPEWLLQTPPSLHVQTPLSLHAQPPPRGTASEWLAQTPPPPQVQPAPEVTIEKPLRSKQAFQRIPSPARDSSLLPPGSVVGVQSRPLPGAAELAPAAREADGSPAALAAPSKARGPLDMGSPEFRELFLRLNAEALALLRACSLSSVCGRGVAAYHHAWWARLVQDYLHYMEGIATEQQYIHMGHRITFKEALDLRAAVAGGLVCTDLCELGNDFSPLGDQLGCCISALPHFSPHSIAAPVHVLAGAKAVHRMRWMTSLAMGVENDFISYSKELSAALQGSILPSAAIIDRGRAAEVLRLLYRCEEDAVAACAAAVHAVPDGTEQLPHEQRDRLHCTWKYFSTLMAFNRNAAQAQLLLRARYMEVKGGYQLHGPSLYQP